MAIISEIKTLWHIALSPVRGKTHEERLTSFYGGQAKHYDAFRKRLLHGREDLCRALPAREGDVWADLGGGTGQNIAFLGEERLAALRMAYVVDLCAPLLSVAQQRIADLGWANVETAHGDATTWTPAGGGVDLATFSYSLTMIPDWFRAVDHALDLLKPGGHIGVVDFYVARKYPAEGHTRHPWRTRMFWPLWFANDNVFLSSEHVPYLHHRFEPVCFEERRAPVPYLPGIRVPIYLFIGKKR